MMLQYPCEGRGIERLDEIRQQAHVQLRSPWRPDECRYMQIIEIASLDTCSSF